MKGHGLVYRSGDFFASSRKILVTGEYKLDLAANGICKIEGIRWWLLDLPAERSLRIASSMGGNSFSFSLGVRRQPREVENFKVTGSMQGKMTEQYIKPRDSTYLSLPHCIHRTEFE